MGKETKVATDNAHIQKGVPLIITDKRSYTICLDETEGKLVVKVPRKICNSNDKSYAINVGTYFIEEKKWQYENKCILRPNLKLMVEELAEEYLLQQTS